MSNMPSGFKIASVVSDDHFIEMTMNDGTLILAPIMAYPKLANACQIYRDAVTISNDGKTLHWVGLREKITLENILHDHSPANIDQVTTDIVPAMMF